METDKELLRQGRYSEALGDNYNHSPYSIIPFDKDNQPLDSISGYDTFYEADNDAKKMNFHNYIIFDSNADWL